MAEETEGYSMVVGQNAWERGKYSRLDVFPQAFSVCIVTEVSLEASTEQTNPFSMAEERSERLCRCSRLTCHRACLLLWKVPLCWKGEQARGGRVWAHTLPKEG